MADEPNEQPKFAPKIGPFEPILFNYGTGQRLAPRSKKNRPKQEVAEGWDFDVHE
jgi:hypothetical protein